jgi:hypothetical protein
VTLSRKETKSRTHARGLRSSGTKVRTRVGRIREPRAELEKRLEARTRELSEAREQQAATAEVLRIISSSPGKLEPVFETILANATRLCEAKFGTMFLYEEGAFRVVAQKDAPRAYVERWSSEPVLVVADHPSVPLAQLARTRELQHIPNLELEQGYIERAPPSSDSLSSQARGL